ncbi:Rtt106 domain-containing protein [Mycena sanguinolenta]|uniref:Rtt106 domain-containing protein n=1 Tax=Mycena sanguinolenta TaxID=230812 RepID=A0A8H6YQ93_9AGAR|nr:Rtt106 domain-containing protein [Mycena sanguinolenta]
MSPTTSFSAFLPLLIDTLAYGVYSALFFQSLQVLYTRRTPNRKIHLGCIITLFVLSTIHITIAYTWASITDTADFAIYELFTLRSPLPDLYAPVDPSVVRRLGFLIKLRWMLAKFFDAMKFGEGTGERSLFHYCHMPALLSGGFLGLLPLSDRSERVALVLSCATTFFTNTLASLLAAGRIWWMSRQIAMLLGKRKARSKYMDLTAIILESGLMYPAILIITIVFYLVPAAPTVAVLSGIAAAYHLVGIAPTMIMVRVGLGVSTGEVKNTVTLGRDTAKRNTGLSVSHPMTDIQFGNGSLTADDETSKHGTISAREAV